MKKTLKIAATAFALTVFAAAGTMIPPKITKGEEPATEITAPEHRIVTEEELNSGTTKDNAYKSLFDYWGNADEVKFTENGAEISGKNRNNIINMVNAPLTADGENEIELVINFPLFDKTTNARVDGSVSKLLFKFMSGDKDTGIYAHFWGDKYKAETGYVMSEFYAGSASVKSVKLPKRLFEVGGGVKIAFSKVNGWMAEAYDEETDTVTYKQLFGEEELAALKNLDVKYVTRINAMQKWADATETTTKITVKEVNGQSFCLKNGTLTISDCLNVSDFQIEKGLSFGAGQTIKAEFGENETTKQNPAAVEKTTDAELFALLKIGAEDVNKGYVGMGDIGFKGENTGIYITVTDESGNSKTTFYKGTWGKKEETPITFDLLSAGENTVKFTFVTNKGNVTVKTIKITAKETPKIIFENSPVTAVYQGETVTAVKAQLVSFNGENVIIENIEPKVTFNGEEVSTVNGSFTAENKGTYKVTYTAEYEGETYEREYEITVNEDYIVSIKVTVTPTKTTYTDGEEFDKTGMKVVAVFTSGKEEEIADYTVDKTTLSIEDKSVIIEYNGKKTPVLITVNEVKQGGCGAFSGTGAIIGIMATAVAATLIAKKKRDN